MTNSEYVRNLDDEGLADFIAEGEAFRRIVMLNEGTDGTIICIEHILNWLKEEYVND